MVGDSNNGCGMSEEIQGRIFEPFFTTKANGTGLGLATVFAIVKQNGGFIGTRSAPGQGTTFHLHFPAEAELPARPEAAAACQLSGSGRVLVVEDDPVLQIIITDMVGRLGYPVQVAGGPAEALALLEADGGPFDLMLTDVVMPGLSGRDLWDRVQVLQPGMRVLFMSGYTDEILARKGGLDPDNRFIPKPFTLAELKEHLAAALTGP
jgi:CheY-like chemotaxis protein